MNITKELLHDFNIISMCLLINGKEKACIITKSKNKHVYFKFLSDNPEKILPGNYFLHVTTKDENQLFLISKVKINIIEINDYTFRASIIYCDELFSAFIKKLSILDWQDEKYGRRKEQRFNIGKKHASSFGLSSLEQKLIFIEKKIVQPCAILDVSVHGICIITPFDNPLLKHLENFYIQISFAPAKTIIINVHKVNIKINKTQNTTFATISCQLLEPINYYWKEKIINLIENN